MQRIIMALVIILSGSAEAQVRMATEGFVTNKINAAVSEQAATNALFTAWLAGISGRTNLWNEAWAWGNHALAGYAGTQTVSQVAADVAALSNTVANLPPPADPTRLLDSQGDYFQTLENGTGTVWQVTGPFTNYVVTLSEDFLELTDNTRPSWTNNVFPFTYGAWVGAFQNDGVSLSFIESPGSVWEQEGLGLPAILAPVENAQGTAIVSIASIYLSTNAVRTFATGAEIQSANAAITSVSGAVVIANANIAANSQAVANVAANLQPFTQTLYGDLATTNVAGFAGFITTNGVALGAVFTGVTNNQPLARFRHDYSATTYGACVFSGWATSIIGAGPTAQVYAVASAYSQAGAVLATSQSPVMTLAPNSTSNITVSVTLPAAVTNGYFIAEILSAKDHDTRTLGVRTGGAYPTTLTLSRRPLGYATPQEVAATAAPKLDRVGGVATNPAVVGTLTLNGDAITAWPAGGGTSAPSIIRPVLPSAATVSVTSTQAVYYVALDSASTVTQNVAALGLSGTSEASWKLMLDLTTTNALASTIAGVTFDSQPEFTVTGRYEFAMQSIDGVRVLAKQTWPETYAWEPEMFDTAQPGLSVSTNAFAFIAAPRFYPVIAKTYVKGESAAMGKAYEIFTLANTLEAAAVILKTKVVSSYTDYIIWSASLTEAAWARSIYANQVGVFLRKTGTDNTGLASAITFIRPLNALERAAYDAGWRP